jgi:hypothetical protein
MDLASAVPLPLAGWLHVIDAEYLSGFVPEGGAAVKFALGEVPGLDARLAELAARHGLLAARIDAAHTRLHMLQDVFFAIARALPWQRLAGRYLETLFAANGYPWPKPGTVQSIAALAQSFGVAPSLLARHRDTWLSRDLFDDRALAQDFRSAVVHLCLAQLEPEAEESGGADLVLAWLRGEKVPLRVLRAQGLGARITRASARAMLASLCHWLRKSGAAGLLVALDARQLARGPAVEEGEVRYSPASVMDAYEVLRELIDDIEHLPGLFVVVQAGEELIGGDPRRSLAQYPALQMRVWPDVRPGDRQNPLAPLVWLAP